MDLMQYYLSPIVMTPDMGLISVKIPSQPEVAIKVQIMRVPLPGHFVPMIYGYASQEVAGVEFEHEGWEKIKLEPQIHCGDALLSSLQDIEFFLRTVGPLIEALAWAHQQDD